MNRNWIGAVAAFAVTGASAMTAGALNLQGSDTLELITDDLLAVCSGTSSLVYIGGGSTTGETAIINNFNGVAGADQEIAPMSRALNGNRNISGTLLCDLTGEQAEGYGFALDGLAIVQSRREASVGVAECDTDGDSVFTDVCPATDEPALYGSVSRLNADQECIGLVFANPRTPATPLTACTSNADCTKGQFCPTDVTPRQCVNRRFDNVSEANGVAGLQCPGCQDLAGSTATNEYDYSDGFEALKVAYFGQHTGGSVDCNSDVRHGLLAEWRNITRTSCEEDRCVEVRHLWRRGDLSGTTDTFRSLLGISSSRAFCNGTDLQDNDPVRRTCIAEEDVCGKDGTLGVLLPVFVPEGLSGNYPTTPCQTGNFAAPPAGEEGDVDLTQAPRWNPPTGSDRFNCLNDEANTNTGVDANITDGRFYNLFLRQANGTIILDASGRKLTGSYYRIHSDASDDTPVIAGDEQNCRRPTSTDQIGCLVQADPCTLGYAGLEATTISGATNLKLKNVRPTTENIRRLVTDPTNFQTYPFARFLFLNTLVGFSSITDTEQDALADCFADRATVDPVVLANGFITLDDTATGTVPVTDACP